MLAAMLILIAAVPAAETLAPPGDGVLRPLPALHAESAEAESPAVDRTPQPAEPAAPRQAEQTAPAPSSAAGPTPAREPLLGELELPEAPPAPSTPVPPAAHPVLPTHGPWLHVRRMAAVGRSPMPFLPRSEPAPLAHDAPPPPPVSGTESNMLPVVRQAGMVESSDSSESSIAPASRPSARLPEGPAEQLETLAPVPRSAPSWPSTTTETSADPSASSRPALPHGGTPEPGTAPARPLARATAGGPIGKQSPVLSLETVGPATISQGKPLSFETVVRNSGVVAVFNVHVEEELPAGSRFLRADPRADGQGHVLTWNVGSLEPGAERRFKVEIQPAGEGEMLSCATATFSLATCLRTRIAHPQLSVTLKGPESVQVGDPAVFHIQVTNSGTGPATKVVLHDHLPPGLQHPQGSEIEADLGTLEAQSTRDITLQTTAIKAGRHVNEASASFADGPQASAAAAVQVSEGILTLRVSGPQRRFLNREAVFDLEVTNAGTATAANVHVVDTLPAGLEFVTAEEGAQDAAARTVTWNIGNLAPGQHRSVSLKVVARSAGELVNRVVAQAERGVEARAEATLHTEAVAALMLAVTDQDDPIEVGAETTYEIRLLNQGTAASTGVQIQATVPEGMTTRSASGPVPYRIQGQQVIFDPLAKLAARADCVFRIKVVGRQAGDWRFKVRMTCDQLHLPVYEEESTRVYSD